MTSELVGCRVQQYLSYLIYLLSPLYGDRNLDGADGLGGRVVF